MKKLLFGSKTISIDAAALALRLVFGLSMAVAHGWGKFSKMLEGDFGFKEVFGLPASISLGLAVFSELICAGLVVVGLGTRAALIPLIVTMSVAVFDVHWNDEFSHMEKALLYLVAYVALFFTGPGKWSVDKALKN